MRHIWLALAVLFCGTARGVVPSYSAIGIVTTGSYAAGPFAPNSLITIFGSGLARSAQTATAADIVDHKLPAELNSTRVYIDNGAAPLLYVSESQINLLIPAKQAFGAAAIWVMSEGQRGPEVTIQVVDAAPALFVAASGYAIATHADNSLISPEQPAKPGEVIVIYAAGLGKTETLPAAGELAPYASPLVNRSGLRVTLNGTAVDPERILYGGLTPGSAGLYQVNVALPASVGVDPELRIFVADAGSPAGVKLALRGTAAQLYGRLRR